MRNSLSKMKEARRRLNQLKEVTIMNKTLIRLMLRKQITQSKRNLRTLAKKSSSTDKRNMKEGFMEHKMMRITE